MTAGVVTFRPLRPEDAREALRVIQAAFATNPGLASSSFRESPDTLAAQIAAEGGCCAVGAGDAIRVALLWEEAEGGLYLKRLSVLPEARGLGLAKALVARAEGEGRRRGLPRLWLKTRAALDGNLRLFAACGFAETGREPHERDPRTLVATLEKRL